jgi:hypothetical protein
MQRMATARAVARRSVAGFDDALGCLERAA